MKKNYILKKSYLVRKNSFFIWNFYSKQVASHNEFYILDDLKNDQDIENIDSKIRDVFGSFKSFTPDGISSLCDPDNFVQNIAVGEEVADGIKHNLSAILSFQSLPQLSHRINLQHLNQVSVDFLLDEIEPSFYSMLNFTPGTMRHLPFPEVPQVSSNEKAKKKIIFAFHSSEIRNSASKQEKSIIEIITKIEGIDILSLDLDLCISEYKEFSWERIALDASKVISVSSNPLTNSFLIELCNRNCISFQHWDRAKLSPLRFVSDIQLAEDSYLNKIRDLEISFRKKMHSLLFQDKKVDSFSYSICTETTKLDSYNELTISLMENLRNQQITLPEGTFNIIQQLILGSTEIYERKASYDTKLSLSVRKLLFAQLEKISGSDLLFKLIAESNSSAGFIHSTISKRSADSSGSTSDNLVHMIIPKILNPLFCYYCLDKKFSTKNRSLLEEISQILSADGETNGISPSVQWLVTCYTIMDEHKKMSTLIDKYFDENLGEIRYLMIYNLFISTVLKHENCFSIFNKLIAPAEEKSVIFLKNEILRAITYYLRNDLKKAEEIFHYVYENDPNIFNKKYHNDWVNIDLMMCRLCQFNNEQKHTEFFKLRSDANLYNPIFAKLFDSTFDQLGKIKIPPFSLK